MLERAGAFFLFFVRARCHFFILEDVFAKKYSFLFRSSNKLLNHAFLCLTRSVSFSPHCMIISKREISFSEEKRADGARIVSKDRSDDRRETPTAANAFKAYDIEYADRIKASTEGNSLCATCV